MKFLIVFALAFNAASAFSMANSKLGITSGNKADVGQFPYQVGINFVIDYDKETWCGGSLIGDQWILTAAHCTDGVRYGVVYLGATERKKSEIKYTVKPSDFVIHHDWTPSTKINDISLIKIPATTSSDNIKPIKLPAISTSYSTYDGEKVVTSGWGLISESAKRLAKNLQWARFEVIDNTACSKQSGITVIPSKLCVSTPGGVSTCDGDSGGALVLECSNIQVGVIASGLIYGCTKGYPAFFTRVTSYLDWIKEQTGIFY